MAPLGWSSWPRLHLGVCKILNPRSSGPMTSARQGGREAQAQGHNHRRNGGVWRFGADTIFLPVPCQPSSRSLPGRLPVGISSWEAMRSPFTWKRMKLMAQDDHTLWGLSVGLRDHRTKPRELSCNSPRTLALSGPQCHLLRYPRVQDTWRGPQKAPASSARWSLCQRSTRPSVLGHPPGQPPAKPGEAEKQRGARGSPGCLLPDKRPEAADPARPAPAFCSWERPAPGASRGRITIQE